MKKVLYVAHGHPARIAGGAEMHALEMFEAMRDHGAFEPLLLTRLGPPHVDRPGTRLSVTEGAPGQSHLYTTGADFDYFSLMAKDKWIAIEHFRRFLEAHRPDVVHFQHTLHLGLDLIREARHVLGDVPILYTLHEFLPICANSGQLVRTRTKELCKEASPARCHECFPDKSTGDFFLRKRLIQSQLALVDQFIAPSQFLLERYVDWGIPREKIRFQEYGRPQVVPLKAPARPRTRFGFFGQLNPFKGIDVLLGAMGELARGEPCPAQLTINGANLEFQEPSFREEIRRLAAEASRNTVLAGRYERSEIPRLMKEIDWVIIPSVWWENSPLVIQEAFQHGKPVLCSDIGGMAEKVSNGVNGLHFRAGDRTSLAATIRRAATTEGLWEQLVAGIAPIYAAKTAVEELSTSYLELMASRRAKDVRPARPVLSGAAVAHSLTLEALDAANFDAHDRRRREG